MATTPHRAYPLVTPSGRLDHDVTNLVNMAMAIDADVASAMDRIAMGTQGGSSAAFTYDGSGRIDTVNTQVDGDTAAQAFAYNGDGSLHTVTTTFRGTTRVETFAYTGGAITAITSTTTTTP